MTRDRFSFAESLERRCLLAGIELAVDLDRRTESAFPDTGHQIVVAGDRAFGDVGVSRTSGEELAFSDGTPQGTRIVKEIVPGLAGTNIDELHAFGNLAVFTTKDSNPDFGKLWRSDGTEAGTFPLLSWGTGTGLVTNLWYGAELGGKFYFPLSDRATNQTGLGVTDGTVEGTGVVKWLGSTAEYITAFNGNLYFSARDSAINQGTGDELWKSDGTAEGTVLLKDINPGTGNSYPRDFTPVGSTLYFSASQGSTGLWKTDGTATGTQLVTSSSPRALTNFNGTLLFSVGNSIFRTNATTGVPALVKSVGFTVWGFETAGSRAYFVQNGNTYWQTDGTSAGTVPLSSSAGPMTSVSADMTRLGSKMLFRGNSTALGDELWITDGTVAGTTLVADLRPGAASSTPWRMVTNAAGTRAFFAADDGTTGYEMWVTDGTAAGTRPTVDLNLTSLSGKPRDLTKVGGDVYLWTWAAPVPGVYKTNGTQSGTTFLGAYEIAFRPETSRAPRTAAVGNRFFFSGRAMGATNVGFELHVSDGTPAGTKLVKDITPGSGDSLPENLTAVGNTVFFVTVTGTSRVLWRSDGTEPGTVAIDSGVGASIVAIGQTLYFYKGDELWKVSAAAGAAAQRVASGLPTISGMGAVGGQVVMWCQNGTSGDFLYRSDGTPEGTALVATLPTSFSTVRDITDMGDGSAVFGYQGLWRTDLTAAGTVKISDVEMNAENLARAIVWYRGQLYFKGTEPIYGIRGLWKTDGTAAGTSLVSAASGSFVEELTVADGRIFFRGYGDGAGGSGAYGVWESNGTPGGTRRVPGQSPDQWLGYPAGLTEINGALLYVADDRGLAGEEVFKILPDAPAPLPTWVAPGSAASWNAGTRTLSVTGAASIVADPGVEQLIVAEGTDATLTIDTASGSRANIGGLWIADDAVVTISSAGADRALVVAGAGGVNVGRGGRLDLTDNRLILRSTAGDRVNDAAVIAAKIKSGLNLGGTLWTGDGITTSLDGDGSSGFGAIGVIINDRQLAGGGTPGPVHAVFGGETVGVNDILVRYTVFGDADLDGAVGTNDYFQIDNGFLGSRSGWINGDFDYDGAVSTNDYFLIDNAFLQQPAAAPAAAPMQPPSSIAVRPRTAADREDLAAEATSLAASLLG